MALVVSSTRAPACRGLPEGRPGGLPYQGGLVQIVHAGPAEGGIAHHEARRLDDPAGEAETGAHPEDGGGIGGDVGLVEGDFDHDSCFVSPGSRIAREFACELRHLMARLLRGAMPKGRGFERRGTARPYHWEWTGAATKGKKRRVHSGTCGNQPPRFSLYRDRCRGCRRRSADGLAIHQPDEP